MSSPVKDGSRLKKFFTFIGFEMTASWLHVHYPSIPLDTLKYTRTTRKLARIENAFRLARITCGTCACLPSQPSPYCCSPSFMGAGEPLQQRACLPQERQDAQAHKVHVHTETNEGTMTGLRKTPFGPALDSEMWLSTQCRKRRLSRVSQPTLFPAVISSRKIKKRVHRS